MSWRQQASRPRSICSNWIGEELSGGRISTPTTRKSESKGSSLVPRLPETPVIRTVRLGAITTWATVVMRPEELVAALPHQYRAAEAAVFQRQDQLRAAWAALLDRALGRVASCSAAAAPEHQGQSTRHSV